MRTSLLMPFLVLSLFIPPSFADVPDGDNDRPDHPDIFYDDFETEGGDAGSVSTMGDNQPVDEFSDENGNPHFDFDQDEADDSDYVDVGHEEEGGMQELNENDERGNDSANDDRGGEE